MRSSLVGSEMCIRDSFTDFPHPCPHPNSTPAPFWGQSVSPQLVWLIGQKRWKATFAAIWGENSSVMKTNLTDFPLYLTYFPRPTCCPARIWQYLYFPLSFSCVPFVITHWRRLSLSLSLARSLSHIHQATLQASLSGTLPPNYAVTGDANKSALLTSCICLPKSTL